MRKMIDRLATDIQDGDTLVILGQTLNQGHMNEALVVEKTIGEDGRVQLLVSIHPDAYIVTPPRPREMEIPESPFDAEPEVEDTFDNGAGEVSVIKPDRPAKLELEAARKYESGVRDA